MIQTRGLTRLYGERRAVDGLDLDVPEGAVYGLLGPNGAGKSTLLAMLCGGLRPSAGEMRVAGLDPARDRERLKRVLGFMPQSFGGYDYLSVAENLELFATLHLSSARAARARVAELLVETDLLALARARAAELSGGWRQRLGLALSLVHRPRVLLLDEPTAGVDPVSRRAFWDVIEAQRARRTTILVTTHYMEEVERCQEVGLLAAGRLRLSGAPAELKAAATRDVELVAVAAADPVGALAALRAAGGVRDVYLYGDLVHAAWPAGASAPARARSALSAAGVAPATVMARRATMEDVFVNFEVVASLPAPPAAGAQGVAGR